jgi:hypothetical protein
MKKMMLLASVVGIVALMMAAAPAFADDGNPNKDTDNHCNWNWNDCNNPCNWDWNNCNNPCNWDWNNCNNDNNVVPAITQSNEQEVESGDVTQTFNVTGGGDNSNQIVGIQGVANTGNAVNNTGVIQAGPFFDGNNNNDNFCDFFHNNCNRDNNDGVFNNGFGSGGEVEIADSGNFTISPSQTVSGTQQVNQTAVAVK